MVENERGLKVKRLKFDNGGEYKQEKLKEFCATNGIKLKKLFQRLLKKYGVVECMNRTLNEYDKSMRIHASLPKMFWAKAVNTVTYLINHLSSMPLKEKLLEEVWSGKEVNFSHLRVFGYISYVHIDLFERSKFNAKSKKCSFVMNFAINFGILKIGKSSEAVM